MPDAIAPVSSSVWTTGAGADATQRPEQFGKDTFLKLLVAQLRYQDPTSPTDGAEFLAQTAQFTVVEKLEELSKTNSDLLAASLDMTATSLVGRSITYTNAEGTDATGIVTATRFSPTGPVLRVGDDEIQLGAVKETHAAPQPPADQQA